ncbi:DUF1998 domain-containing protein [Endozoicomonas sp. ONNA2]|uniref:DUF1998 domain-containing protein n=1 Tax=Endozoicomonas sp. ONNA2 TaxID=2828741 RepID=UPI002147F832|nr:DUF1998 domain-containing protein [Endozoicomonas sp. ONNA2]
MNQLEKYSPVRLSHLISYSGIGAIFRNVNDQLMVICDTRFWTDRNGKVTAPLLPYVERIKASLQIHKDLRTPPVAKTEENDQVLGGTIPAVLFPKWTVCPYCNILNYHPWHNTEGSLPGKPHCTECSKKPLLQQVSWCAVSNEGYLSEVPWHWICHKNSPTKDSCRNDYSQNYLKLAVANDGKRIIKCMKKNCHAEHAFEEMPLKNLYRIQPWLPDKPATAEKKSARVMEVNDPLVYLPHTDSGLVIPPESRKNGDTPTNRLLNATEQLREIQAISREMIRKGKIKALARELDCSEDDIRQAMIDMDAPQANPEINLTPGQLLPDEYNALLTPLDFDESEDFVTRHKTAEWQNLASNVDGDTRLLMALIDNLVVVDRLRQIQVFLGFTRGEMGGEPTTDSQDEKQQMIPPDITGEADWIPAIELFGEGVFITLNEQWLKKWETEHAIKLRARELSERYENTADVPTINHLEAVTPRFLLLHTFAHLLIRELEATGGYPAASLKERIYTSNASTTMSGILIYTAVADVAGSLGGIVESAEPLAFLSLLEGALKHAQWCSLDPVCSEHEGQGPGWLNRAACHACALVPETSCSYNNVFLDRTFIKGNPEENIPGLLDFLRDNYSG